MALLPAEGDVRAVDDLGGLVRLLRLPATLWEAFTEQVGNPGGDIRVLAALPAHVVVHGIGQSMIAGQGLSAVEAAHVGLVWRVARFSFVSHKGRSS